MTIQVREVGEIEAKSVQEQEQEFSEEYEKELAGTTKEVEKTEPKEATEDNEVEVEDKTEAGLTEEDVLSFIRDKYQDKEIQSIEDLLKEPETKVVEKEVPEDIKAYLEYKEKTGRGFDDYMKLNRDYSSMSPDDLLLEWKKFTEKGLDDSDIRDMIQEEYSYDEDVDDEADVKRIKRAKKKAVAEAIEYFEDQKKMFKAPLESRGPAGISEEDQKKLEAYQQYVEQSSSMEEQAQKRRDWFNSKTEELFNDKFEGFEFEVDNDRKIKFSPGKAEDLKSAQSDTTKFFKKFIDENGLIADVQGFHKALTAAMNPDKMAKFFYDLGKSEGTDGVTKKIKNVDMSDRPRPETASKDGVKVSAVNPSGSNRLVIKKKT